MATASHSTKQTRQIFLHSASHWDLWSSIAVGGCVATASLTTELDPKRAWIIPLSILSIGALSASLQQWTSMRSKLSSSDYGELIRIADESEVEVRMPYQIAIWTAMASVIYSVSATVFIEGVEWQWAQAIILAAASLFATWSLLALISTVALSLRHDRNVAQVEAMREKTESAQRMARTEHDQAPHT